MVNEVSSTTGRDHTSASELRSRKKGDFDRQVRIAQQSGSSKRVSSPPPAPPRTPNYRGMATGAMQMASDIATNVSVGASAGAIGCGLLALIDAGTTTREAAQAGALGGLRGGAVGGLVLSGCQLAARVANERMVPESSPFSPSPRLSRIIESPTSSESARKIATRLVQAAEPGRLRNPGFLNYAVATAEHIAQEAVKGNITEGEMVVLQEAIKAAYDASKAIV